MRLAILQKKTDREDAYKQLPLCPTHQNLTAVALRHPETGTWVEFAPRTLLFGAVAAALRYNAFIRSSAVLFCKITGMLLLSYFDDFGALAPSEILGPALHAFTTFCQLLGAKLKGPKTEKGPALTFLGIFAQFPDPENGMSLTTSLPKENSSERALKIKACVDTGTIAHKERESLMGKTSFSQTSIFGRVGRAMMTSLYQKAKPPYYKPTISHREASTLRCWAMALLNLTPRLTRTREPVTGRIVDTDAATTTQIIAAVVIDTRTLRSDRAISAVVSRRVGPRWKSLFDSTSEIYGLEMLAIFAILFGPTADMRNLSVIFSLIATSHLKPW